MNVSNMRRISVLAAVLAFGTALPVAADETGMGTPPTNTTSATLTTGADANCGVIKTLLGLCDAAEAIAIEDDAE